MKTENEEISQMAFEFKDWEKCFSTWRKNEAIYNDAMQLVISTHWASQGYWIEAKGKKINPRTDYVYVGQQVYELETRVKQALSINNFNPGLIL